MEFLKSAPHFMGVGFGCEHGAEKFDVGLRNPPVHCRLLPQRPVANMEWRRAEGWHSIPDQRRHIIGSRNNRTEFHGEPTPSTMASNGNNKFKLIAKTDIQFSESFEIDGREMFKHACKTGLGGRRLES
jgi:hypothetical protein